MLMITITIEYFIYTLNKQNFSELEMLNNCTSKKKKKMCTQNKNMI